MIDIDDDKPLAKIETYNSKRYFPEKFNWVIFCPLDDEEEFYLGITEWLQFLYDHKNVTYMPPRPLFGFNPEQRRWHYWEILSYRFNRGSFRVKFVEVDE